MVKNIGKEWLSKMVVLQKVISRKAFNKKAYFSAECFFAECFIAGESKKILLFLWTFPYFSF